MSTKTDQITARSTRTASGKGRDARYLGFFECFNRREYFEAHEVLEDLWRATDGHLRDFYQGLIQTAAVYLKLEQDKPEPAVRLAKRALSHLEKYRPRCEGLDVDAVVTLLRDVLAGKNILAEGTRPHLELS